MAGLLAAAAGLLLLPLLSWLPPWWWPLLPVPPLLALARWRRWRWASVLALGLLAFAWSVAGASRLLAAWLPPELEGVPLLVEGVVEGLPEPADPRGQRFRLRPSAWRLPAAGQGKDVRPPGQGPGAAGQGGAAPAATRPPALAAVLAAAPRGRWQLFSAQPGRPLQPGSACRLEVRLKRPHGLANPAGFDFEAWLLSEGVTATGSVRRLTCTPPPGASVDGLRLRLREEFRRRFPERPAAGVLLALLTGDRSLVEPAAWDQYSRTGVVHLMAISGMHVVLLAGAFSWLLLRLLRRIPRLPLRCPLPPPVMLAGFAVAVAYSQLAGYSVPTERTLVMLAVVVLATLAGRRLPPVLVLLAALVAVLLLSPLAVHATGFWLSFGAVAVLMLAGSDDPAVPAWRQLLVLQFAVTLLLLPLTLWFFASVSWVSPFANLLAVPLVTFLIVPLGLAGFLCWWAGAGTAAVACWQLGTGLVEVLDALVGQFAAWPGASLPFVLPGLAGLACLVLAVACLLQPASARLRLLAPCFLLPVLLPPAALSGQQMRLTVIDVGQGLAVLVETAHHALLYDTGPAMGPRSDAGVRVVLPLLRQRGLRRLDRLVLSHDDLDHTGGAAAVLAGIPVEEMLGARPAALALPPGQRWRPCAAGQAWRWEGWEFRMLYPGGPVAGLGDNDRSCVLRISRGRQAVLLPGDLERRGETALLAAVAPADVAAGVLVLGHHGSRTSTSPAFLAAVRPRWALVSAGYRNAFRHPSPKVIARLEAAGVRWRNTARDGALEWRFDGAGGAHQSGWREVSGHYWQANDAPAIFANWRHSAALGGSGANR